MKRELHLLLVASTLAVVSIQTAAAASPKGGKGRPVGARSEQSSGAPALIGLRSEISPTPRLVLRTSGNPAYNSYSPQPDVFVIDLPRASKDASLAIPTNLPSFVASVAVSEAVELRVPLTRVTIRFTQPIAPQATGRDNAVIVDFPGAPSSRAEVVEMVPVTPVITAEATTIPVETSNSSASEVEPLRETPIPVTDVVVTSVDLPEVTPPAPMGVSGRKLKDVITSGKGSSFEISLVSDGGIAYSDFKLTNPNRVVLDLKGLSNDVSRKTITTNDALVKRIRVAQFKQAPEPVTRVVIDLEKQADYQVIRDGDRLSVRFAGRPVVAEGGSPRSVPASPVSRGEARRESTVAATQKSTSSGSDIAMIVDTVPVVMEPRTPERRISSASSEGSSATPVIRSAQQPAAPQRSTGTTTTNTRSSTVRGQVPSSTVRTDPVEDVFIDPPTVPGQQTSGATNLGGGRVEPGRSRTIGEGERVYTGEPIDLTVQDADIKDVLRTFARITGLNIAIDPQVSGTVTVEFNDVPWDQALELILKQNNLAYDLEGNVMRVGTLDRLSTERTQLRKLQEEDRLNVPMQTVIKHLSYARATETQALIAGVLSPRGKIIVDQRTNQLFITDVPRSVATALDIIDTVDIATPQVVIEARIIETTRNFLQQLGVTIGFLGGLDPARGTGTGWAFPNRVDIVGFPTLQPIGRSLLGLTLSDVLGTFDLDLLLSAAENEGLARIVSAPKVTTQDNTPAEISSGVQIPTQTRVNFTTTVAYIDATLSLKVTPQITEANTVIMDISVQKTEPLQGVALDGSANVPLSSRRAQTRLMVRDGGTVVIGGIYQATDNRSQGRVPYLHEIPVIGNLFKNKNISSRHDELLIFITPRIVRNG